MLLCYEVTRDLPLSEVEIETPMARMITPQIAGKKLVFAPMLRAGVTFAEGMLDLVPAHALRTSGFIANRKHSSRLNTISRRRSDLNERLVIVISPVIATANTATAAITRLKERGARDIRFVSLLAAPEGLERLRGHSPRCPDLDRGHRRTARRARIYYPGPGRRRGQGLRH